MTEATSSSGGNRSSVLYAMGKLEATVAAQVDTIRELPERVLAVIAPQLVEMRAMGADHEGRLRSLEKQRWVLAGGGSLAVLALGWFIEYSTK